MNVDSVDSNDLYISANDTEILHANIIGGKMNPLFYKGGELDKLIKILFFS